MKEVTFQKKNGDVIKRYMCCSTLPYRKGYINAYGWKVIDIKQCYNGKYYSIEKYEKLQNNKYIRERFFYNFKAKLIKGVYNICCFFILLIFTKVIDTTINFLV